VLPRRARTASLALVAGAVALLAAATPGIAAPAGGRSAHAPASARDGAAPWATVNVCDTVGHPDGIGVRAWMPGTGDRRDELFMRLQLQFLRRSDDTWHTLGGGGDSGFLDAGSGASRGGHQAGRTFTLSPPADGKPAFVLRGLVTFEWRRGGTVERRARRLTTAGHAGTPGADPDDFSAASCSIR
jgi:hypothetical protein